MAPVPKAGAKRRGRLTSVCHAVLAVMLLGALVTLTRVDVSLYKLPNNKKQSEESLASAGASSTPPQSSAATNGLQKDAGDRGRALSASLSPVSLAASGIARLAAASLSLRSAARGRRGPPSPASILPPSAADDEDAIPQALPAALLPRAGNHRGALHLCHLSEARLQAILLRPHACGFKERRYFLLAADQWMTWQALRKHLNGAQATQGPVWAPEGAAGRAWQQRPRRVECVLACKCHPDLRCSLAAPCLHAFHLRRNSTDVLVLRQLYEWGDKFLKPHFPFRAILDAGANIGVMSVLLATMYPHARIIAVEASSRNFRMLQRNVAPFPNVVPLHAALWPRTAPLALTLHPRHLRQQRALDWAFMVQEAAQVAPGDVVEGSLLGVSVPFLLQAFGLPAFDLAKIDIEGGEGALFSDMAGSDLAWVGGTKLLALELHGWMVPGCNDTVIGFFANRPDFRRVDVKCEYDVFVQTDSNITLEAEQ